jgi:hypothetical protein
LTDGRSRSTAAWRLTGLLVLCAGAAEAQTTNPSLAPGLSAFAIAAPAAVSAVDGSARPTPDLSDARPSLAPRFDDPANAVRVAGFAQTAIDHRFSPAAVTGSVGYLCGLHPGPDTISGPAASSDPVGTFLGAKLAYAF